MTFDDDDTSDVCKRRSRRRRTLKRGYAVSSDTDLRFGCKIADINDHGARLEMLNGVPPPDAFVLMIEVDRQEVDCRVTRRNGRSIGVVFTSQFRYATEELHVSLFPADVMGRTVPAGRKILRRSRALAED